MTAPTLPPTVMPTRTALTSDFHLALLASSIFLVAAALIAMGATNTRDEPISSVEAEFVSEMNPVPVMEAVGDHLVYEADVSSRT